MRVNQRKRKSGVECKGRRGRLLQVQQDGGRVSLLKSVTLPWFVRSPLPLSLSRFCAGLRWPGLLCALVLRCQAYRAINKSPSRANPANPLTDAPLSRAASPSFAFSMTRYVRTTISAPFKGSELVWRSIRVGDSPRYPRSLDMLLNPR